MGAEAMSAGMDALDQIAQRLAKIEANQTMLASAVRRVETMVSGMLGEPCPRCRLQLVDTIPADAEGAGE